MQLFQQMLLVCLVASAGSTSWSSWRSSGSLASFLGADPAPPAATLLKSMDGSEPAAEQGFEGEKVIHVDQETMNEDWQSEHSDKDPCSHCHKYPSNTWCREACAEPTSPPPQNLARTGLSEPAIEEEKEEEKEVSIFDSIGEALQEVFKNIEEALAKLGTAIADAFHAAADALAKGLDAIKDFFKDFFGWDSATFRPSVALGVAAAAILTLSIE